MIEATSTTTNKVEQCVNNSNSSDNSPCSDFTDDSIEICDDEQDKSINDDIEDITDHDADSLDEGVGDVSSDGENQLSPAFVDKSSSSFVTNSSSCETVVSQPDASKIANKINCDMNSENSDVLKRLSSPRLSPVKERIPSRFSFNNTA